MPNNKNIDQLKEKIVQLEGDLRQARVSEQLLREREAILKLIIDQSFQFMLVIDTHGFVLEMNQYCLDVCGRLAENAVGSLLWEAEWWRSFPEVKEKTISAIHTAVNGETVRDEVVFSDKRGRTHQGSWLFTPLRGCGGDIEMISVIGVDISDHLRMERDLDKERDKLQQAHKIAKLGYWYWDKEDNTIDWSDEVFTMLGKDRKTCKPTFDLFEDAIHPDDYQSFIDARQLALTKNRDVTLEHRIITATGKIRTLREVITAYKDENGDVSSVMGTVQDITKQAKISQKYREIIHDQSAILDNIPAYIFFKDTENNIIKTTESVARITGLPREEIEGRHSLEIYPDMAEKYWLDDLEVIRSGKPKLGILESLSTGDGKTRWVLTDKIPYYDDNDQITGVVVFATDITERVEAENQLRESEARFRSVFANSGVGMVIVDLEGNFSKVNAAAVKLFGYEEKELLNKKYVDITHPDDVKKSIEKYTELATGKHNSYSMQKRYIKKNGQIIWGKLTVSILNDNNGKPYFCISQIQDITERVIAVQELEKSEKQYRQIAERIPGMVYQYVLKSNGVTIVPYISSHIKKYAGLTAKQIMKKPELLLQQIHPDDRECFDQKIKESAENMKDFQIEHRILNTKGEERWFHVRSSPVKQECGSILWDGISLDITDRKIIERNTLKYKNIVSSTSDFISLVGLNYVYQIVNNQYLKLSGKPRDKIIGRTVTEIAGEQAFLSIIKPHLDRCFAGENITYQSWFDFPGIGRRYYTITYTPYLENGVVCGAIVNGKDLTQMKSAHDSVRKVNEELNLRGEIAQLFLTSPGDQIYQKILDYLIGSFSSELGYFGYIDEFGELVCPSIEKEIWDLCQIKGKHILCKGESRERKWGAGHKRENAFFSNGPFNTPKGHLHIKNLLFTPLQAQGKLIGQIALANKDTAYTNSDLENLEILAKFISPILHIHRQKDLYLRELNENTIKVEQQNIALKVLLDKRSEEKQKIFTGIVESLNKLVYPFLIESKKSNNIHKIKSILSIIEQNLDECIGFADKPLDKLYRKLTTTEIKVVNLLRLGNSSKEVADMLNMSTRVVYFHRNNIRRKLGLHNEKVNLQAYLLSI